MPTLIGRWCVAAGVVLAIATVASSAPADLSESDKASAKKLLDDGRALLEQGDAEQAQKKFEAADAIVHLPSTMYFRALAASKLGRLREARELARVAVELPITSLESTTRSPYRARAEALALELDSRIPKLELHVVGATPATRVTIDGSDVPLAANVHPVDPGKHRVEASVDGRVVHEEIVLSEGQTRAVHLDLTAPKPPDTPPPVKRREWERTPTSKALMYGGFGVGAAGVVVGSTFGLLAFSSASEARSSCSDGACPEEARSTIDAGNRRATLANVGFGFAAIGAAVGVIGLVLPMHERLVVVPGPTGFALRATF